MPRLIDVTSPPSGEKARIFHNIVEKNEVKMAVISLGADMVAGVNYTKRMMFDSCQTD